MGTLRFASFDEGHLDAAAGLLAARHRRDRQDEPRLPARFAELAGARAAIEAIRRETGASGVVALRDGQLAGYLIGAPDHAEIWGRSVWIRYAGHALASDEEAELLRDLYAAASPPWLARGLFAHYVEAPAGDHAGLDAWFRLGFGHQQAYAIRPLLRDTAAPSARRLDPAIIIRRAGPDDHVALAEMGYILWAHLGQSPTYSVRLPEEASNWAEAAPEALADPRVAVWLAARDGAVLSAVIIRPLELDDETPDLPEDSCYFAVAATREDARGQGIGSTLLARALDAARDAGYLACLTDWRMTNLPASRLWPQLGFRPFEYRLHRLIDSRIAWAKA